MPHCDTRPTLLSLAAAALLVSTLANGGAAQEADDGGLSARLDFSQRLVRADGDLTAQSLLSFGLDSRTRDQYLLFSADGTFETTQDDLTDITFVDPALGLRYGIENRQTSMAIDLAYFETDVDSVLSLGSLPGVFFIDSGTRRTTRADIDLEFGRETPFGATVALGALRTAYEDTTDPDLFDTIEGSVDVALRFDIDRRISARISAGYSETDRDGGTDVTRERLGVGATFDVTQTTTVTADIGVTRLTEDDGASVTEDEGLSFSLGVSEARPNGVWTLDLASDIDESGRRSTVTVGRTIDLRDGSFAGTFGLSEGSDAQIRPLYSLSYSQDMARGAVGVSLDQSFDTGADGLEALNTSLIVDWDRELTRAASLRAGLALRDTNVLDGAGDARRLDLSLDYSRALTRNWDFVGGVTRTIERQDSAGQSTSNEIFIGLSTDRQWRP